MNLRCNKFKAQHGFAEQRDGLGFRFESCRGELGAFFTCEKRVGKPLGFGSFSGALLRGEKNIKRKKYGLNRQKQEKKKKVL